MKLCGSAFWGRISRLIVLFNLLLVSSFVYSQNLPPVLSLGIPNQHAVTSELFTYTVPNEAFIDKNNDLLTYSAEVVPPGSWPSWLNFDPSTKSFSGVPSAVTTITIKVIATDPGGLYSDKTFKIMIHPKGGIYAAFTMNTQMGCNSRFIQFENKSNNATSYLWNFGNGNHSPEPTPIANYPNPGTYTVTLQINNNPSLVHTEIITIYPNPIPVIDETIKDGCELYKVTLNSIGEPVEVDEFTVLGQTVGAITGGTGKYYYWYSENFPDQPDRYSLMDSLTVDSLKNGYYAVALEVTDVNGCVGIKNYNDLFEVWDKPVASFSYVKDFICKPSNTDFTRNSEITGSIITKHEWRVNEVLNGSGDSFSYTFPAGQSIVSLIETSEHGCVSSPYIDTIVFNKNNFADFGFTPAMTCLYDTVQFNSQVSTGGTVTSISWDFDNDGNADSEDLNPVYNFNTSGQNPVSLSVEFNDGCLIEKTKNIPVDKVTADFEYDYHGDCWDYITVDFTDKTTTALGSSITSRRWYYRQTGALYWHLFSIDQNPVLPIIPSGNYDISLVAVNNSGCSDSIAETISFTGSSISMNVTGATSGCFPVGITNFAAVFNSEYDVPVSYNWQFGDGNTGTGVTTSHAYAAPGNYNVKLVIKTEHGCTYTSTKNNAVQLANQPVITDVILHPSDHCFNSPVVLEVDYPDGTDSLRFYLPPDSIVYVKNPGTPNHMFTHYFSEIGNYTIGVMAIDNNCQSEIFNVNNIQINGPRASFRPAQTAFCSNPPYSAYFINETANNTTTIKYTWDFGDGTIVSGIHSPTHEYTKTGDYAVKLTARDTVSGCTDSYEQAISVYSFDNTPGIIEASDTSGCTPLTVTFSQNILDRLSENYVVLSYEWDFDNDGTTDTLTTSSSIQYTYTIPGVYSVGLKVNSESGCSYSFTESNLIRARGPIVLFDHSPLIVCSGTTVTFTNNSKKPIGDNGVPVSYLWNFGDGETATTSDITHQYNRDTIFSVSLSITDSNGCTQTLKKKDLINILPFTAAYNINESIACSGSEILFINTSEGSNLFFSWDFNNDNITDLSSGSDTVSYIYNQYGDFTPILTVTTLYGCSKSASRNIHIINATTDFEADTTTIGCAPSDARFTPLASKSDVITYSWSFGDGITADDRIAVHRYFTPGYYDVSLQIVFKGGCKRDTTKEDYLFVKGAYGVLNYDATPSCSPNKVQFILSDMRSVDYVQWDFGNGNGESYSLTGDPESDTITYSYSQSGNTKPSVVLSSNECSGSYTYVKIATDDEPLEIYTSLPPDAEIWMDRSIICQGVGIQFRDSSIVRDAVYPASDWRWIFASTHTVSDESNEQNPVYAYSFPGIFTPKLIVSNELGCKDSTTAIADIKNIKNISSDFTASDYLVCPGQEIFFDGTASSSNGPIISYEWNFGDSNSSSAEDTIHSFGYSMRGDSANVLFVAKDNVLCSDSTTRTVDINNLQAALGFNPQHVYRGDLVDFEDQSTSDFDTKITSWVWNFERGNPPDDTVQDPDIVTYDEIIEDNEVTLIVSNSNGCYDTATVFLDILNNPPVLTSFSKSILRNTKYIFSAGDFESNFRPMDPDQIMEYIRIIELPTIGVLTFNGIPVIAGQLISTPNIGGLKYTSSSEGLGYFTWNAYDGIGYSDNYALVNIEVLKEPDPPTLNDIVFNIPEDYVLTFDLDTFTNKSYFDNKSFPGFNLDTLIIKSIPTIQQGTLIYKGSPVIQGDKFTVTQIASGHLTITPVTGYEGTISFRWNGFDGLKWGISDARVIINYNNAPPGLTDIIKENLPEDSEQTILQSEFFSNYSDPDINDNPVTFFLDIATGTPGTFLINNIEVYAGRNRIPFNNLINVVYRPEPGGNDLIEAMWGASDGQDTTFVLLRLKYENTPPICHDIDINGNEDEVVKFTLQNFSVKYPDGPFEEVDRYDILDSIRIISLPVNGTLSYLTIPFNIPYTRGKNFISNLRYTPSLNWSGRDSFMYNSNDGTDWSNNVSYVIITVNPVNDAPVPETDYYSTPEDEPLTGKSVKDNDIDIDDDWPILKVSLKDGGTAAQNGTISLNQNGSLIFRPKKDVNGTVWLSYEICDDEPKCSVDTVYIEITPVNDPPTAVNDSVTIFESTTIYNSDETTNLLRNDEDIDGNPIILVGAGDGSPGKPITGDYGIIIINSDGSYSYETIPDSVIKLDQTDVGRDVFYYTIADQPDSLTSTATIIIRITGSNNPPVTVADTIYIDEGEASVNYHSILDNDFDPEGKVLSVIKVNNITEYSFEDYWGTVRWSSNGDITYEQNNFSTDYLTENENLDLEYQYSITDGQTNSHTGKIIILITGTNDAPIAVTDNLDYEEDWDSIKVNNGDFAWLLRNDYDPDKNSTLSVIEINGVKNFWEPAQGTVGVLKWNTDGSYTYIPDKDSIIQLKENDEIFDIFTYIIADPLGATDTDSLVIKIIGANDKPNPVNDTLRIPEDTFIKIVPEDSGLLVNDSDPEHQKIIVEMNGQLSGEIAGLYGTLFWDSTGAYTYQSDPLKVNPFPKDTVREDIFFYTIRDPEGSYETASLTIIIKGQNDAPVANNDYENINEKDPPVAQTDPLKGMLDGDRDVDEGDIIRVISINNITDTIVSGIYGLLDWSIDGTYTYTLNPKTDTLSRNEEVRDSFIYVIEDLNDSTDFAYLIFNITGENDNPFAQNDTLKVSEDTLSLSFTEPDELLLYNDSDRDGDPIRLVSLNNIVSSPFNSKYCYIEWDGTGAYKYIRHEELDSIPLGTTVHDSIKYSILDQYNFESSAYLHIFIKGENDVPVAEKDVTSILETADSIVGTVETGLLANDYDVDSGDIIYVQDVKGKTGYLIYGTYGDLNWKSDGSYIYYNKTEATDPLKEGEIVYDFFPYTIIDNNLAIDGDTLVIKITGVNDFPVAVNDTIRFEEDAVSVKLMEGFDGLLENDSDIDGDEIEILSINDFEDNNSFESIYGLVTWGKGGSFIFEPDDKAVDPLRYKETATEEFTYIINDQLGKKDTAKIVIIITGNNDNPIARNDFVSINEDIDSISGRVEEMTSLLSNDNDIDGDTLSLFKVNDSEENVAPGVYGDLRWDNAGEYTFYTNSDETNKLAFGDTVSAFFQYIAADTYGGSDTARLEIEIIGVNDPPVALPDSFSTFDIKSIIIATTDTNDILDNDYDVDGINRSMIYVNDAVKDTVIGKYGTLIWINDGSFEYYPDSAYAVSLRPGEQSTDEFSYVLEDEWNATDTSIIDFTIMGINNAPIAKNDTLIVYEDDISRQLPGLGLLDSKIVIDSDKDTLHLSTIENATEHVISGVFGEIFWKDGDTVVYVPRQNVIHQLGPNQTETEVFSYIVTDGELLSNSADLVIILIGMNDSIYAINDTVELNEDEYIRKNLVENDIDPDNFNDGNYDYSSLTILDSPFSGKAYINSSNGVISYFPDKDYYGKDSLKYRICDTGNPVYCDEAWMIITVNPVNDPPEAIPLVLETMVNTPVSFNALLQVKDIDDGIDPNSIDTTGVKNIELRDSIITYTPELETTGKVEFTYSVKDSSGVPAFVIVTIIIKDSLSNYQAVNDKITTKEDTPVEIEILSNDTIGGEYPDPRSVEIKVFPENGIAEYDWYRQLIIYQPDEDFNGSDSLTYIVSSGLKNWSSAKVYITVEPVNDSLVANDDLVETFVNTSVEIHIFDNDIDGDNGLDFTTAKFSKEVVYNDVTGIVTYIPPVNFKGFDTFTYSVCDKDYINTSCDSATVTVFINPRKSEFYAIDDDYTTLENTLIPLDNPLPPWGNDSPIVSGDSIVTDSFKVVLPPQNGTFTINPETNILTYIPKENFFGNDWISYSIYDNAGNYGVAQINIWVEEVNTPPVANDDSYMVSQNEFKRLYILENDFDPDGSLDWSTLDTITGAGPKLGLVEFDRNTGTIFYKPEVNKGDDSFTYNICDDRGSCSSATVNITVELDTSIFIYRTIYEDAPETIDVKTEMAKYNFKFDIADITEEEAPEIGEWKFTNNNTNLVYSPDANSNGTDDFRLNICSNDGQCAYLRIYIKILAVNDPPVAVNDTIIWNYITDITIISYNDILKNDYDIDSEIINLTTKEMDHPKDSLIFNWKDSTITITADTIFWCDAWFTYEIKDGEDAADTGKVYILPAHESYKLTANDDNVTVDENSKNNPIYILNNDLFLDNQRCTIDTVLILTYPENGNASATDDNYINYSPRRHYYEPDSLEYQIIDLWGQTDSAWVYIDILEKNIPPVAVTDDTIAVFGSIINIPVLANDYDPDAIDYPGSDGDPNAFIDSARTHIVTVSGPLYGTVEFDPNSFNFIYSPDIESCEDDMFQYTIYDNEGDSSTATVTIVMPDEAPLFAIADTVKTYPGIPVDVEPLLNDNGYFAPYIADNTIPYNGYISVNSQNVVTYNPNPDFVGRDSMRYTIISPCENSAGNYIIFLVEELRVPEIITPNGDSKNDVLIIDGIEYFPDNLLQIYNRYGHIVYQKKTYDNTWGGYSNRGSLFGDKPLPAGTYYYTLIYNEGRIRQAGIIYIFW